MKKETFGSIYQFPMLEFLTEKISLMNEKDKKYICSVIHDINLSMKKSQQIEDVSFKTYILDLIHEDFNQKIKNYIEKKHRYKITTYLLNYLNAKIKHEKRNSITQRF